MTIETVPQRRVSVLLGFGIAILPFVFAWVLLRRGYGNLARALAFGYLGLFVIARVLIPAAPDKPATAEAKAVLSSAATSVPSSAAASVASAAEDASAAPTEEEQLVQSDDSVQPDQDAPVDPGDHRSLGQVKAESQHQVDMVMAYSNDNIACINMALQQESLDQSRNQIVENVTQRCVQFEGSAIRAAGRHADPYPVERSEVRSRLRSEVG
jgi:hypothetical protein